MKRMGGCQTGVLQRKPRWKLGISKQLKSPAIGSARRGAPIATVLPSAVTTTPVYHRLLQKACRVPSQALPSLQVRPPQRRTCPVHLSQNLPRWTPPTRSNVGARRPHLSRQPLPPAGGHDTCALCHYEGAKRVLGKSRRPAQSGGRTLVLPTALRQCVGRILRLHKVAVHPRQAHQLSTNLLKTI
jgi:hypothetical protein